MRRFLPMKGRGQRHPVWSRPQRWPCPFVSQLASSPWSHSPPVVDSTSSSRRALSSRSPWLTRSAPGHGVNAASPTAADQSTCFLETAVQNARYKNRGASRTAEVFTLQRCRSQPAAIRWRTSGVREVPSQQGQIFQCIATKRKSSSRNLSLKPDERSSMRATISSSLNSPT